MSKTGSRLLFTIVIVLQVAVMPLHAANERISGFSSGDTITIRSAEARMDELSDIIHFGGGFEIRANDFYLLSEEASLYGKLDDPETIEVTGSPATIRVDTLAQGQDQSQTSTITGQAMRIIYQRNTSSILMEGDASLSRDGHTMSGGEIEYDIKEDHLRAGGAERVHIRVIPDP